MNVYERTEAFYRGFQGEKLVYGRSAENRALFAFFVGAHERPIAISQAAIHGREWITALLSLFQIGFGVRRGGVWILPLTNPDGALLSQIGICSASRERRRELISLNGGPDFSLWKANAEGVDLNVNFDARWGEGEKNVSLPGPENYVGQAPFSAPESRALRDFTLAVNPDFTVSWHTKGEEIYWKFHQPLFRAARDRRLAKILSRATGCPIGSAGRSAGGYKDWCVEALRIPAFTVEVGGEELSHPLKEDCLGGLAKKYGGALDALTEGYHGRKVHARGDQACGKGKEEGRGPDRSGGGLSGEGDRQGVQPQDPAADGDAARRDPGDRSGV